MCIIHKLSRSTLFYNPMFFCCCLFCFVFLFYLFCFGLSVVCPAGDWLLADDRYCVLIGAAQLNKVFKGLSSFPLERDLGGFEKAVHVLFETVEFLIRFEKRVCAWPVFLTMSLDCPGKVTHNFLNTIIYIFVVQTSILGKSSISLYCKHFVELCLGFLLLNFFLHVTFCTIDQTKWNNVLYIYKDCYLFCV